MMTGTGQIMCLKSMMRQPLFCKWRIFMIYRTKNELEKTRHSRGTAMGLPRQGMNLCC